MPYLLTKDLCLASGAGIVVSFKNIKKNFEYQILDAFLNIKEEIGTTLFTVL